MFSATAGAHELCGLCGDLGRVADAVESSTLSADEEDLARRLLHHVCVMLGGRRDSSFSRLGRGAQRSRPYPTAVPSETGSRVAETERTDPLSSGGGQPWRRPLRSIRHGADEERFDGFRGSADLLGDGQKGGAAAPSGG